MDCLTEFRRVATPGTRWRVTGWRQGEARLATVIERDGTALRYRWYRDSDGGSDATWLRWSRPDGYRFDGRRLELMSADGDTVIERWELLDRQDGPLWRPPADERDLRQCQVQQLQPGDVVYGWASYRFHRRRGYTVASVDVSVSPAVITTVEGWPVRCARFATVAMVPVDGDASRCPRLEVLPPARKVPTRVYIGAPTLAWVGRQDLADIPKCVSRNRVDGYKAKRLPPAAGPVLWDSGGFMELKTHGRWRQTPEEYVAQTRRCVAQLGRDMVVGVAQQDWMCEQVVIDGGVTREGRFVGTRTFLDPQWRLSFDEMVELHQDLTTQNWVTLRRIAPDLPIFPVVQGFTVRQYERHLYELTRAGLGVTTEPLVGLGSVCRRQGTAEVTQIVRKLAAHGVRLHGFGVGVSGLSLYGQDIISSDSTAGSYNKRVNVGHCVHPDSGVKWEQNCQIAARGWWEKACARLVQPAPVDVVDRLVRPRRMRMAGQMDLLALVNGGQ